MPPELSVDRYADLEDGATMMDRHLSDLAVLAPIRDEEENLEGSDEQGSDDEDDPPSPSGTDLPSPVQASTHGSSRQTAWQGSSLSLGRVDSKARTTRFDGCDDDDGGEPSSDGSPRLATTGGSAVSSKSKLSRKVSFTERASRSKAQSQKSFSRDSMKKQHTTRQETLQKLVADELLPSEYRARALNTCWVSPAVERLNPSAVNRSDVLGKPMKYAFQLKMETPPVRSTSTPALRAAQQLEDAQARAKDTEDAATYSMSSSRSITNKANTSGRAGAKSQESESLVSSDGHLPRMQKRQSTTTGDVKQLAALLTGSGGTAGHTSAQQQSKAGGGGVNANTNTVGLVLHPPKNLSGDVIRQRLEDQAKGFRNKTYAQYMKDFDILTGKKKEKVQASNLRREEDACLQKMARLIGGEPQRLTFPRS